MRKIINPLQGLDEFGLYYCATNMLPLRGKSILNFVIISGSTKISNQYFINVVDVEYL